MVGKYKVITLCGSTRFKDQFFEAFLCLKELVLEARAAAQGYNFVFADHKLIKQLLTARRF